MSQSIEILGLQGVSGHFVGASDSYILELEKQIGFHLPYDYVKFAKKYGASIFATDAIFRPIAVSPWATNGQESFDIFYGMSENPKFDLHRINIRLRNVIGTHLIAIGHDPGSNLILIDPIGQVLFFDRETGKQFLCANTFEQFLDSFEPRRAM